MGMRVKVVQLGRGVLNSDLEAGATVQDALSSQRIPFDGMEVRVNSEPTTLDHPLREGDLVTVVPLIRGGST
jgi:sulfur carrier protein ThiS